MKDYYAILECTPMSTRDEIKRQYRKLAQQFHPDKNQNDNYAAARFHDIKEAYETLTQPSKKEAWLQERWLHQVYHKNYSEKEPLTPYSILDKVLKLDRYVSSQDVFRMDQEGIAERIMKLVSDENMNCLLQFNEKEINKTIVQYLLSAASPVNLNLLFPLWPKLEQIAEEDRTLLNDIHVFQRKKKKQAQQEKWTLPIVILVTILICVLIYSAGK
ncbi:MAG TPA: DnaJ domain-containing protein [Chitinophagaceae bacterium]|nr:DnaJ domain-containing protein [Chitinophagaceae bacterium]